LVSQKRKPRRALVARCTYELGDGRAAGYLELVAAVDAISKVVRRLADPFRHLGRLPVVDEGVRLNRGVLNVIRQLDSAQIDTAQPSRA